MPFVFNYSVKNLESFRGDAESPVFKKLAEPVVCFIGIQNSTYYLDLVYISLSIFFPFYKYFLM